MQYPSTVICWQKSATLQRVLLHISCQYIWPFNWRLRGKDVSLYYHFIALIPLFCLLRNLDSSPHVLVPSPWQKLRLKRHQLIILKWSWGKGCAKRQMIKQDIRHKHRCWQREAMVETGHRWRYLRRGSNSQRKEGRGKAITMIQQDICMGRHGWIVNTNSPNTKDK